MSINWIDPINEKPKPGELCLLKINYQRMIGGEFAEDEVIITGGFKDGSWYVGHDYMFWDYQENAGFTEDDVIGWVRISDITT